MSPVPGATPELLEALVDDAGLFPPEQLPMAAALARHRADEAAAHAMLAHRFLCPASRLDELRTELGRAGGDAALRLGLILDTGLPGLSAALEVVAAEPRLSLELVEVPVPEGAEVAPALEALAGVEAAVYLEGPRAELGWVETLAGWSGPSRRGAKVRCGGARPEQFPSPQELARFISACAAGNVAFKATAGLHHAVRAADNRTGLVHHGFLNLLVATARAEQGEADATLTGVLACEEPAALAEAARSILPDQAGRTRSLFVAYGSCSTSEPLEDLAALGLGNQP